MTSSSDWYTDPFALLEELRQRTRAQTPPPTIPGYGTLYELRRGGQGVVYTAVQESTGQRVAIKVLLEGAFASRSGRRRFEREIELIAQMWHPNIVRVYDSGTTADGRLYSVMEYIEGRPLDEWLAEMHETLAGAAYIEAVLRLFQKACDAVHYAHLRGVVHRDLKPSNIRVGPDGEPHVLDFGLAKDTHATAESVDVSVTGQFMGSLPWASPEQADGFPNGIDVRTDVYSLGVILYQMLAGRFPYETAGPIREMLQRILTAEPARPSTCNRAIDEELETVLLKCLAKEPERRYQGAGDLAADLRRYQAGEPLEAKRDSAAYMLRKNLRRYRWPLTVAGAFMVLLAASSIVAWILYAKAETNRLELVHQSYADKIRLAHEAYGRDAMKPMRDHLQSCLAEEFREFCDWEWRYLNRRAEACELNLLGHQGTIWALALSPDGTRLPAFFRTCVGPLWRSRRRPDCPKAKENYG